MSEVGGRNGSFLVAALPHRVIRGCLKLLWDPSRGNCSKKPRSIFKFLNVDRVFLGGPERQKFM